MSIKKDNNIIFRELDLRDLHSSLLKKFSRYQETKRVWFQEDYQYKTKEDHFIEQWDDEKKAMVICDLQNCIKCGGIVVGAFVGSDLVGFASVEGKVFGSDNEYLELSYIHVSNEHRNMGIGKRIFEECSVRAKEKGATKLYIAAHPSEETQHFYRSVGCRFAVEVNQSIFAKEPLDIQLEYCL